MLKLTVRTLLLFVFLAAFCIVAAMAADGKPNIVFLLVDNVGWGDFGVYGGQTPTPRIDALAHAGIRFDNYTVESQCTPTRAVIMTGRLPIRSGTYNVLPQPEQRHFGLAPWEYTIFTCRPASR